MRYLAILAGAFLSLALPAAAADTVCIQCHSGQSGRLGEPVKQWQGSIHQANGIGCHNCHGGDPTDFAMAMRPERGFLGAPAEEKIPAFCGRCHPGVLKDYQASAHGQALGEGGPQCVTCHHNHAVHRASLEIINSQLCSRCHSYERAEQIRQAMAETDARITALQGDLQELHRLGIATKELQGQVFAARNSFHQLFHTVDVRQVRQETTAIQGEIVKVRQQVDAIQSGLSRRKLWGAGAVVLLLLGSGIAFLLHRDFVNEYRSGGST